MSLSDLKRSCVGKQNHADPICALMACMAVYQTCGLHVFPYKCRHCPNWHLGHTNPSVRAFIAAFLDYSFVERAPVSRLTYSLGDAMRKGCAVLTFNPAESGPGRDLRFAIKKIG